MVDLVNAVSSSIASIVLAAHQIRNEEMLVTADNLEMINLI
jgi:hypothetical protein